MILGESTINTPKTSKEARGKRLKIARMQIGLSRAKVERKYGISRLTQGNWENGKAGGLTEKGAKRMVYALKEEGLHCTLEWLLDGIGSAPYPTDRLFTGDENQPLRVAETVDFFGIEEELLAFRRCNKDAIDMHVEDDGMLPFYRKGDYVAGIQYFEADIQKAANVSLCSFGVVGASLSRRLEPNATRYFICRSRPAFAYCHIALLAQ